jgi:ADP-ribose pyrophosphatase
MPKPGNAQSAPRNAKKAAPANASSSKAAKPAKPAKAASNQKAVLVSSETVFQGKVFSVTKDTVIEPGGHQGVRDVVRHHGSVVVLAVDSSSNPADPTILIERQYRHAAGQFMLELPAGSIDAGETPLAAAKRELIEETGFRAGRWSRLVSFYASPGFVAEAMHLYLAENLKAGIATPEEDEKIELLHIPLSELLARVAEGNILDGKTIAGVLFYRTFRFAQ